ncbi:hypothetical protein O3M35_010972 [Rhynocoris fuscipes]|uniref:F-box domain-containing protein n=1 Tax=Rhynocoris fuscipes TaxID=488301 RepID=A0AAW1D719_9HEMI
MSDNVDIEGNKESGESDSESAVVTMSLENNHHNPDNGSNGDHLLVLDGTPSWLHHILHSLDNPATIVADAFISTLYILIYETGFTIQGGPINPGITYNINVMREICDYTFLKRIDSSYKFWMSLSTNSEHCILVAIPISNIMIVNFYMTNCKTISLTFNMNDFVRLNNNDIEILNGRELSLKFSTALCEIRSRLVVAETGADPKHILSLPTEILLDICNYLTPNAYLYFSLTCKHIYYRVYNDESVWSKIGRLYLPSRKRGNESWRDFVIYQIKRKQEQEERLNRPPYFPDLINWPYLVSI